MGIRRFFKVIAIFLCAAVCGGALLFAACAPEDDPPAHTQMRALFAESGKVYDDAGYEVTLRGVNAGGLFVTEHWMTGFSYGTQPDNDYRSLTQTFLKRFGEQKTKELWAAYRSNWWTDADFARCADMGMNVIRLPFTYMNVDFPAVTDLDAAGQEYDFSAIEAFVNKAAEYGLYTILDLHGAYGSQNGQDHSGQIIDDVGDVTFYSDERLMSLTVRLWEQIALHFKDNPAVAGYDILNEPGEKAGQTSERHWEFFDRAYDAIRAAGDEHIVIFESPQPAAAGGLRLGKLHVFLPPLRGGHRRLRRVLPKLGQQARGCGGAGVRRPAVHGGIYQLRVARALGLCARAAEQVGLALDGVDV